MKKKISSIVGAALAIVLILSLVVALAPAAPANEVNASPGEGKWEKFPTPKAGVLSSYLLVPGNGVWAAGPALLTKAIDGSLYAYWDVGAGDPYSNLYKSTDNGRSWSRCSSSTDELSTETIIAIAPSTENADVIYVATSDSNIIFKSIDGGDTFTAVADIGLTGDEVISCFDVGFSGGTYFLVVGTANTTIAGTAIGNVYVRQDTYGGSWVAQSIDVAADNVNVRGIATSPNFATEGSPQIVAVVDNSTDRSFVTYQYAGGDWVNASELQYFDGSNYISITANLTSVSIAFPTDYDSKAPNKDLWIGVSTDNGTGADVYHVVGTADPTDQQIAGPAAQTPLPGTSR